MRLLISLLLIAYLVGVGVTLSPTIKTKWTTVTASQFFEDLVAELPNALAWPATAYRRLADRDTPVAPEKPAAPEKPNAGQ